MVGYIEVSDLDKEEMFMSKAKKDNVMLRISTGTTRDSDVDRIVGIVISAIIIGILIGTAVGKLL